MTSSKSKPRERDDYNGARTALTEAEWVALAAKRHGAYVVIATVLYANGPLTAADQPKPYADAMERFNSHVASGWPKADGHVRVRVTSHTDYVMRLVAEAALVAL